MRVAAHLVRGGRSLGHEHTLPEEDTSVTENSYGPHILLFSFHSFIFDFFQLEEYPFHKLRSVELSDGCSQTHSEETETAFVNRLGKGAENQNGNLRWHLPLGGGGLEGVSFAIKLF